MIRLVVASFSHPHSKHPLILSNTAFTLHFTSPSLYPTSASTYTNVTSPNNGNATPKYTQNIPPPGKNSSAILNIPAANDKGKNTTPSTVSAFRLLACRRACSASFSDNSAAFAAARFPARPASADIAPARACTRSVTCANRKRRN